MKKCRYCGREIPNQDYRVVGYETNEVMIPVNINVHTECLPAYRSQQNTTTAAPTFWGSVAASASLDAQPC